MTTIEPGKLTIEREKPQQCDDCGKVAELRPYGPPGKTMICFDCGMKGERATMGRFGALLDKAAGRKS